MTDGRQSQVITPDVPSSSPPWQSGPRPIKRRCLLMTCTDAFHGIYRVRRLGSFGVAAGHVSPGREHRGQVDRYASVQYFGAGASILLNATSVAYPSALLIVFNTAKLAVSLLTKGRTATGSALCRIEQCFSHLH